VAQLADEWAKRNTKVIGLSVDGVDEHKQWKGDIAAFAGAQPTFPIIADTGLEVSKAFDMLPADAYLPDGRTAADSASVRSVFIISPDKKVQLIMTYPMSVGRNFAEVLRALDGLQATFGTPIATPANWTVGQDVIVALSLNDDQAREKFGEIDVKLPYLRTTKLGA
jgi:alkyl hydroperoxide reductase subunit AhpC